jgi:hypothetical protein
MYRASSLPNERDYVASSRLIRRSRLVMWVVQRLNCGCDLLGHVFSSTVAY